MVSEPTAGRGRPTDTHRMGSYMPWRRAFTFVEIMIVMVLAVGVISIVFTLRLLAIGPSNKNTLQLTLQSKARITLERIVRDLRAAKSFEKITPDNLSFERFSKTADIYMSLGSTEKIGYVLKKRAGDKDILVRFEQDKNRPMLDEFSTIDEDMFRAYYYDEETGKLKEFNYDDNPSDQREKVSLIRVHLGISHVKERIDLYTDITVRYIWSRNKQPHWNPVRR